MNRKRFAAAVLSALLYAQGLLGFAGIATVLMKGHADAAGWPPPLQSPVLSGGSNR